MFFGLIASGKSTLAQAWAERYHLPYYNSDRVRKELAGLAPTCSRVESFAQGIYTEDFSEKTYTRLLELAAAHLKKGTSVVLDASYHKKKERQRLCRRLIATPRFVLCVCSEPEMKRRMACRQLDSEAVSDGRWEIYLKQKDEFELPEELAVDQLLVINTGAPVDKLLEQLTASFVDHA